MSKSESINYCAYTDCDRKLKLTSMACKCKKTFCKYHKLPEQHICEYDYKETNYKKQKIIDMKCISDKLNKF